MLIHLAAGGENSQESDVFTKEMLIHLGAGGGFFQNCELFTKEMLIHLAAGGGNFQHSSFFSSGALRGQLESCGSLVLSSGRAHTTSGRAPYETFQ